MSKNRVDSVMDFTVTLIQMSCKEGDRESNFARAREFLKNHKPSEGVDFIVLPELFAIGFRHEDYDQEGAGVPGSTSEFLSEIAKEHGAYVFATDVEKNGEKYYNTLAAANPSGEIVGTYRKIHPFQEERDVFDGGTSIVLMECGGIKVGVQICYDVRFPEISRRLALEGAEILIIPAAFPDPRNSHWNTLVQARAVENQVYVAAVNRVGFGFDGKTYFGHSQFIDPWGVVLTRINSEERTITSKGNTEMIETVRNQITCYADRSPTGYDDVEWFRE
ncbi:MAG: nitrilase-related carbon-nitrogen hydrolase [Candidatus Thorarchaeota archaeon]